MGYCNRCGDIINSNKCRKCGGKPVESLARGNTESKSIVDRWQNQYANSILSGPEPTGTTSTPLMKRNSVTSFASSYRNRSPSISVQPKTCILCHKVVPLGTNHLAKVDYCNECRVKIFDKKTTSDEISSDNSILKQCVVCFENVKPEQPKVQHQGRAWHKDCIRCFVCSKTLSNPTVLDLQGASRCLDCQKQNGPSSIISPTSTVSSRLSGESRFSPIPRSTRRESFGSLTSHSTLSGDYGTYNSFMADKLSTRKKSMDAISSYSRPQLDSKLFQQYQKSIHHQSKQINSPSSPINEKQRPITPTSPNKLRSLSPSLSTGLNDLTINNNPVLISSTSTKVPTTKNRRSSVSMNNNNDKPTSKKTCRKCMQQLHGPRVRLPTPSGDTWYYHYDCLTCAACGDHFTESEFVGDGKDVFHLHCRVPSPPRSTSPPSPVSNLSTSLSTSPIPSITKSTSHLKQKLNNKKSHSNGLGLNTTPKITDYRCHTCHLLIEDKYLKNGTRLFHPKCFTCSSCHEQIPSDKPFYDIQQEAHCESCTQKIMKTNPSKSTDHINSNNNINTNNKNIVPIDIKNNSSKKEFSLPLSPSVSSPLIPWDEKKGDTPSHIWMNRTKALPKLGGSKICPGCNLSISVMDDTPGPKASRWHKKCLKCTGCKKQMDSGAKIIELEKKWLVKCSDCSDKNPIPKYVR